MIRIGFNLSNPWATAVFDTIWSTTKPVTKNKFIEIEVFKLNTIFEFGFTVTHRTSHAGVSIEFGMFNRSISINLLDHRHWDYNKGQLEAPEESA